MEFVKRYKKYIIIFVMLLVLSFFFPFSGDDYYWGSKSLSINTFKEIYNDLFLNGRWLGNFIAISISHSHIIKAIVITCVITLLIYIIDKHEKISLPVFLILIMLMPVNRFIQVIVWGSGFSNYMVSTLLFISIYYLCKRFYKNNNSKWYEKIGIFIIALLNSLVVENITVGTLIVLFIVNLIYFIKNKKININLLIMFIGSLIGAILMFIHPSYLNLIFGNSVNDRYIPNSSDTLFSTIKTNLVNYYFKYLINENLIVHAFNLVVILILFLKKKFKNIGLLISFYLLTIIVVFGNLFDLNKYFILVIDILYLICYLYLIYKLVGFNKDIWEIVLLIISVILPLVFIYPLGERLFFLPYVLQIILMFRILNIYNIEIKYNKILYIFVVWFYIVIMFLNVVNYIGEVNREKYVKEHLEDKIIIIDDYKFSKYVWFSDFTNDYFTKYYNLYHGYDEDIKYIIREK